MTSAHADGRSAEAEHARSLRVTMIDMKPRPFFARLIVIFAILLAMIVAVCGGVIYVSGQRAVRSQQLDHLRRLTPLIKEWVASAVAGAQTDEITPATRQRASRRRPYRRLPNHPDRGQWHGVLRHRP